jgi:alpha-L-fucosidase
MGGNLLLNISPMGDGSIPEAQQKALLAVGEWLRSNGEGIYGSYAWTHYGEGPSVPSEAPGDWKGGSTANAGPHIGRRPAIPVTEAEFRFTTNNGNLYAFGLKYPASEARIRSLAMPAAKVEHVTLLGPAPIPLMFRQTAEALIVTMPPSARSAQPYTLRIEGSHSLGAM